MSYSSWLTVDGHVKAVMFIAWAKANTGVTPYIAKASNGHATFQMLVNGEPVELDAGKDCRDIELVKIKVRLLLQ